MTSVSVVGAGLSGLATAWYFAERGATVRVFEAAPRPGGLIQTQHVSEGVIEAAARAFTWSTRTADLFSAAGISPSFARDESKRRYIFRNGRATRWPLTPIETAGAAARFGRAWLGRQVKPRETETVAAWGTRVLGTPATTWLLAPALQGIYASPPTALSAAALFGKKRPPRGKLAAPSAGMGAFVDALHEALVAKGVAFEFNRSITPDELAGLDSTVVSTSAPAAARLLTLRAPAFAAALDRIRMVSLVVVTAFYTPHEDDLRGFGVLFPRSSGIQALGALFNAEIFAGRSHLRSETWMYGELDRARLPATESDVHQQLARDRLVLTGRSTPPIACYIARHFDALPVYDAAVVDAQRARQDLPVSLSVAGNYLGRLGVSSLLDEAAAAAERAAPRGVAA